MEAWFELGKEGLWQKLKNDPELGKRGANGIRSHLEAMVRPLSKSQIHRSLTPLTTGQEALEGSLRWLAKPRQGKLGSCSRS